jgi:hypothetical protein
MYINRLRSSWYLLWMSLASCVWSFILFQSCKAVLSHQLSIDSLRYINIAINVVYGLLFSFLTPPRLRDIGFPKWTTHFTPFLLVTVIIAPVLLFYSGEEWDNEYGSVSQKPSIWVFIIGLILFLIAMPNVYDAMNNYLAIMHFHKLGQI